MILSLTIFIKFRNGAEEADDDWLITDFARQQLEEYLRQMDFSIMKRRHFVNISS
jgi:hypothetical protein